MRDIKTKPVKCCYVGNTDWLLYTYKKGILKSLHQKGFHITCIGSDTGFWEKLKSLKMESTIKLKRYVKRINPLKDLLLFYELYRIYKKTRPDIALHFTIKPVIYGPLAAKLAGVPVIINSIMGLGYIFTGDSWKKVILRSLVLGLYRLCGIASDYFFFENHKDRNYFLKHKIVSKRTSQVVFGSGVDVKFFSTESIRSEKIQSLKQELYVTDDAIIVLMVTRMLYDKGVYELVKAGRMIQKTTDKVKFILAGPLAPGNPSMIPLETINNWVDDGTIQYLGRRSDIRELMYLADIVVLPSYYREGLPSALMEAAAMGKPIITTNSIGCKEAVNHGENGFLVPIKDYKALQTAIERLSNDAKLRIAMGKKSRQRAIEDFDEKKVIEHTFNVYHDLLKMKV